MNAQDIMTTDAACCTPDDTSREAAHLMAEHDCVPVVDAQGSCVGMIAQGDLARQDRGATDLEAGRVVERTSEPLPGITPTRRSILVTLTALLAAACVGGDQQGQRGGGGDTAAPAQAPGAMPGSNPAGPAPAGAAPTDARLVALGDSIFHGRAAGGTCATCHGQGGVGGQLAPNLTDSEWHNGDGSYQSIVNIVTTGVPVAKKHPGAMPPMGGASLTPEQVRAVAAYVYSLGRRG